ncbi:MAG: CPBP family glutamic-type intramembrane protease [Microthrixaceae bacterium]
MSPFVDPSVVIGAPVGAAIANTLLAFLGGTVFYVIRRATGTILAAMAAHGLWDFTLFSGETQSLTTVRTVVYVILVIAIIVSRRHLFSESYSGAAESAGPT